MSACTAFSKYTVFRRAHISCEQTDTHPSHFGAVATKIERKPDLQEPRGHTHLEIYVDTRSFEFEKVTYDIAINFHGLEINERTLILIVYFKQ